MKPILIMFSLGLLCLQSFADQKQSTCIDKRKALFPSCQQGKTMYDFKGQCVKPNEVEGVYCASEEMTNLEVVKGEVEIAFDMPNTNLEHVYLHGGAGAMVIAEKGVARNCIKGEALIGQPKAAIDNYNPEMGEIGLMYVLLRFSCMD